MIGEARALGSTVVETLGRAFGRAQERRPLPVDLLESDDAYLAVFDAPGAVSSDVQARYEDGTVYVRIDRFRDFHEGYEMAFPGRGMALDGQVSLPDDAVVDPDAATATIRENGTLHVTVPKREEEKAVPDDTDVSDDEDTEVSDDEDTEVSDDEDTG